MLKISDKKKCYGCSACYNICPRSAIIMQYDNDKFKYPIIDSTKCINCHLCEKTCPTDKNELFNIKVQKSFGGYNKDIEILKQSTSGGAFSAIVDTFCDDNYVIFGVASKDIYSYHDYITDKKELYKFRQSKYVQSDVGDSYKKVKEFLNQDKKVLFSGTPCQIAGLKSFLNKEYDNLLLVEVICEGVPSPLYAEKYSDYICNKKNKELNNLEYRFKDKKKWDFQVMKFNFKDGTSYKLDRWFNPFWNIWLKHLMSRPSCYECQFARKERTADITLGDLWGVHLYCPDLYNKNKGASVIFVNTEKGLNVIKNSDKYLYYREININDAIRYQGPLRGHIKDNPDKIEFMNDLHNMGYEDLIKKWYTKPSFKLLYSKYVWGNRQKMFVYNLTHKKKVNKMKKIGIVSYNIYCNFTNYGSALQSYALYTKLKQKKDLDVYLVNYCPKVLENKDPLNPFGNMWDKDEESKKSIEVTMPAIIENYWKFDEFYKTKFQLTKKYTDENFNDIIGNEGIENFICGSDTIFCTLEFGGFVEGYFANHKVMKENYSCSYAASFGDAKFNEIEWLELEEKLKNFKKIGVREATYVEKLKNEGYPIKRVIDPTLLLTSLDYDKIASERLINEDYLLLYARRNSDEMTKYAEDIAKKNGLKIVDISLRAIFNENHIPYYNAGVEEFLSLVKYSSYVVTNSFHGAIFSLQYQKPVAVFIREQADTKIDNLVSLLGCKEIVHKRNDGIYTNPDYKSIAYNLKKYRKESEQFLDEIVNDAI